ncbi:hypothetical protein HPP92_017639 [Vanilla planifolia]|uniref:Uncharacterized protein n=1 Tax=Vanilla planifolia TaxID=51239 RepID=A0A835UQR8_VANPL|nr:hypothetical protein HPP92_017639 [Vanilla planifolia]
MDSFGGYGPPPIVCRGGMTNGMVLRSTKEVENQKANIKHRVYIKDILGPGENFTSVGQIIMGEKQFKTCIAMAIINA